MPTLLNSSKALANTTGTSSVYITLQTAQPYLGITPTTGTGYTLVTGANNQVAFTSTLGSMLFENGVITSYSTGNNVTVLSQLIAGSVTQSISPETGALVVAGGMGVMGNLNIGGSLIIPNQTQSLSTDTGALIVVGGIGTGGNLNVGGSLVVTENVNFEPQNGAITIEPTGDGTVTIRPIDTLGFIDNMIVGYHQPASGYFTNLVATNISATNSLTSLTLQVSSASEFDGTVAITNLTSATYVTSSSYSGALTVAGGVAVAGNLEVGGIQSFHNSVNMSPANAQITIKPTGIGTVVIQPVNPNATGSIDNMTIGLNVPERGNFTQITVTGRTQSISTTTGAVIIGGGLGVGGSLYAGNIYSNGVLVGAGGGGGGANYSAGDDISITTIGTSSIATISDISTLESVTLRGATSDQIINLTNNLASTSTSSGALVVTGGIGVGGDIHVAGNVYSQGGQPLRTLQVTVGTTPPSNPGVGDFWIDPSAGVEYQYIFDNPNYYWIQFTGV